ncbi:MAG: hypothetical protein LBS75_00065 [Synergistaceae bacterium]|jgi:hypothetical protein|nr:hypothetical protein [Synergistaceae bacterium]
MSESIIETPDLELEMAEARLLANVMLAEKFKGGQGSLDKKLWDLRDRVYFGDAEAMERIRELYRESRQNPQKGGTK